MVFLSHITIVYFLSYYDLKRKHEFIVPQNFLESSEIINCHFFWKQYIKMGLIIYAGAITGIPSNEIFYLYKVF